MKGNCTIKNNKILEFFKSMEYSGEGNENTNQAVKWLKNVQIDIKTKDIDITLKQVKNKVWSAPAIQRATILNKLSAEIEDNSAILAEIENLSRGILVKDTKEKSIKILSEFFSYYSSFAVKYDAENSMWKPEGITVAVFDDENVLWNLGLVLAPALAAGYSIVLQTGMEISPATVFLLELANKVGLPNDVITHIPSDNYDLQPYLSCDDVKIISLFTSSQCEKIRGVNKFHKKIMRFSLYKTPMLVFDTADLDSAVDSVVDSAWGYQGMLPWSVNTILVQENVFQRFTDKLKNRLMSVKIGNDKNADVSYPKNSQVLHNWLETLSLAKSQEIEVFQSKPDENNFAPTLLIGSKARNNNVLKADIQDNTVTVLAFRTLDEAANLANNTRQGLSASVWAENIGLINEICGKLQVSNVCVNSNGFATPYVTTSPIKDSGSGYFGGDQGFYEYVHLQKLKEVVYDEVPQKFNSCVVNAINALKKSQVTWRIAHISEKRKAFQKLIDFFSLIKNNFGKNLPDEWPTICVSAVYKIMSNTHIQNYNRLHFGYNITSALYPRGVVAIETKDNVDVADVQLILIAIYEGNCVLLLNRDNEATSFLQDLSKQVPSGTLLVFPYSPENAKATFVHGDLNYYIGSQSNILYGSLDIKDTKIFNPVTKETDVYKKLTYVQNIWVNVGCSFNFKI